MARLYMQRRACRTLFAARPFAGGMGATLYAAAGDASIEATAIQYRRPVLMNAAQQALSLSGGAFEKLSTAIEIVKQPDTFEAIDVLAQGWGSKTVWMQIRTHECEVENAQITGQRKYTFDADGDIVAPILGTARLIRSEKRDNGGWLFEFQYLPSPDGLQPAEFVLQRTAGPTSPADVETDSVPGAFYYSLEVAGLTDGGSYTFQILARNGSTTKDLLTGLSITADGSGPGAVTGLVAVPR